MLINPFEILKRAGLTEGYTVADLGCGSLGYFVFPASLLVGGAGRVFAVDVDRGALKAVERAAKHGQHWNVHPVWSDIEVPYAADMADETLDLTIISNNLYLCADRAGAAHEARRLTKPGGRILIIEWHPNETVLGPALDARLTPDEVKADFNFPELELMDEFPAGDCHYALIFRKREGVEPRVLFA